MNVKVVEVVRYDPEDPDTYPSVCQTSEDVESRFGFKGGERLIFDVYGNYMGQLVRYLHEREGR